MFFVLIEIQGTKPISIYLMVQAIFLTLNKVYESCFKFINNSKMKVCDSLRTIASVASGDSTSISGNYWSLHM